jgi:hypothetical protein
MEDDSSSTDDFAEDDTSSLTDEFAACVLSWTSILVPSGMVSYVVLVAIVKAY